MIIYSKEPLNVMMKNILLLDDPFTDGYVYVNKETYDQALSLSVTFNQDIGRVKQGMTGKGMLNWAANKAVNHVVSLCSEQFAPPLNMIAPYLAYTHPVGIEWPEDDKEAIVMAYGILHQLSQFVNFYGAALMNAGAKAEITLPKNIMLAYEDSWKAQLDTLDKCVVVLPIYQDRYITVHEATEAVPSDPAITALKSVADLSKNVQSLELSDIAGNAEEVPAIPPSMNDGDGDDITVQRTLDESDKKEDTVNVQKETSGEDKEEVAQASSDNGEGDEGEEEEDLEAKILAMMKEIENRPAEEFMPKEEPKPAPVQEPEKKEEKSVNFGESGSINMTEEQIAAGNRQLLSDYDF